MNLLILKNLKRYSLKYHDIISFLTSVAENVGEDSRFIHMGRTSNDAIDTGQALQLKEAELRNTFQDQLAQKQREIDALQAKSKTQLIQEVSKKETRAIGFTIKTL